MLGDAIGVIFCTGMALAWGGPVINGATPSSFGTSSIYQHYFTINQGIVIQSNINVTILIQNITVSKQAINIFFLVLKEKAENMPMSRLCLVSAT